MSSTSATSAFAKPEFMTPINVPSPSRNNGPPTMYIRHFSFISEKKYWKHFHMKKSFFCWCGVPESPL